MAAADENTGLNFQATYDKNLGYEIISIGGVTATKHHYWDFDYETPEKHKEIHSSFGVSNVVITSNDWKIIMKYKRVS